MLGEAILSSFSTERMLYYFGVISVEKQYHINQAAERFQEMSLQTLAGIKERRSLKGYYYRDNIPIIPWPKEAERILQREQDVEALPWLIRLVCKVVAYFFTHWNEVRKNCQSIIDAGNAMDTNLKLYQWGEHSLILRNCYKFYSDREWVFIEIKKESTILGVIRFGQLTNDTLCIVQQNNYSGDLQQDWKTLYVMALYILRKCHFITASLVKKPMNTERTNFNQHVARGLSPTDVDATIKAFGFGRFPGSERETTMWEYLQGQQHTDLDTALKEILQMRADA